MSRGVPHGRLVYCLGNMKYVDSLYHCIQAEVRVLDNNGTKGEAIAHQ
jgi:hypothetical protein